MGRGKSAQSRNSQVAACSTWVHGKLALSTREWGRRSVQEKKNIFAPKASQEPRFDLPTYTGELVWPALWGRGSNDPGNVAKTHYLLHKLIGHLVTVLREGLQANGPLLHPVMLVRVKVCLFWIFPPYLILAM